MSRTIRAFVLAILLANAASSHNVRYIPQDLGTLGGSESLAFSINDLGQVVGCADRPDGISAHAFLWENGTMTDLGTLGGRESVAYSINDLSQVAGLAHRAGDISTHAFLWEKDAMTDLGTLGGVGSSACSINDLSQVVGSAQTSDGQRRAVVWDDGIMTDLGTLARPSYAYSINALGQVVGWTDGSDGHEHAFLWENGATTSLGTLGGLGSSAYSINDLGQVVGYAEGSDDRWLACLWENGAIQDLGALGGDWAEAHSINNLGQVVGSAERADGSPSAFLWEDGDMRALGGLGGHRANAWSINDLGQVVGSAERSDGEYRAVLWSVIKGVDYAPWAKSSVPDFADWRDNHEIDFVIVDAWGGYTDFPKADEHLRKAREAGLLTGAYCLLNFDNTSQVPDAPAEQDGAWQVNQALASVGWEGRYLGFMAIDVEDALFDRSWNHARRIERIRQAVDQVRAAGLRPMIYTDYQSWDLLTGSTTEFADVPLWDSPRPHDGHPYLFTDHLVPGGPDAPRRQFGGWDERRGRWGKQYDIGTGNGVTLGGSQVDWDVFHEHAFAKENPDYLTVPVIDTLQPASSAPAASAFTLTVRGGDFFSIPGQAVSTVLWNGDPRPTTYRSASELRAEISAADVSASGVAKVTVVTTTPDGTFSSSPRLFAIGVALMQFDRVTLTRSGTNLVAQVRLRNAGAVAVGGLSITAATLATTGTTSALPVAGTLNPGETWSTALTFPDSAGPPDKRVRLGLAVAWTGGQAQLGRYAKIPAASPAPALPGASMSEASLDFTLSDPSQLCLAGSTIRFEGTLLNTGTSDLALDSDSITMIGEWPGVTVDDSDFILNAPETLAPGESWTGTVFVARADPLAPSGERVGCFTIFGGDAVAPEELGAQTFLVKVLPLPAASTIGQARELPGDTVAYVRDAVVVGIDLEPGTVFVESADRSAGMKLMTDRQFDLGDRLAVTGRVSSAEGECFMEDVSLISVEPGDPPRPLGVSDSSIGNDRNESLEYMGLNLTGLLVRCFGTVTGSVPTEGVIYVDGGTKWQDGVGPSRGFRVHLADGTSVPPIGARVAVTGILRTQEFVLPGESVVNGATYPADTRIYVPSIWVRDSGGLSVL